MKTGSVITFLLILFIVSDCISQPAICSYKYRKRITFNPTYVTGSSDLTNFPALINITSDNDLRTVTTYSGHVENTNGYDIIFTSDDGVTKLDHQLERYTASTGEVVAWVRIPSLSTNINTYIYMYYGNTAISTNQSVNTTWNSSYKGVWHLNNSVFTDGTSNANNGTNSGSVDMPAAKIAGGRTFSGSGNYIQLPLAGSTGGAGNGSISFWGRLTSLTASSTYFFGETTQPSYANRLQIYIGDNSGNLYLGLGSNHTNQTNVQTLANTTWYHIALTWSNTGTGMGSYSIYVNGVQKGTGAYAAWTTINSTGDLGNDGNPATRNEQIPGNIDEVHLTNSTLNTDWFLTEYNNQNSPSTFYSISTEPKIFNGTTSASWTTSTNWTPTGAPTSFTDVILSPTTASNQPVLNTTVQLTSLWVRPSTTLTIPAQTLFVAQDVVNCGVITVTNTAGLVNLNSTSAYIQNQSLSGGGTYSLQDLTVNNTFSSNPTIVLNNSVSVYSDLVLTSGVVSTTSANILDLGSGATSSSGSASSFVSGPMSKTGNTDFVFPVGKGTRWRRIGLSSISTATASFRTEYFNTAYTNTTPVTPPLTDVSSVEYWQLDRLSTAGNASVSLYWESASGSGINDCSDLTIARWSGATWLQQAASTSSSSSCSGTGSGVVTTTALVTTFSSPFTFGSKLTALNPLPIELINFEELCDDPSVTFLWTTASENNSNYFGIEYSENGEKWFEIKEIKGAGNSSKYNEYSYQLDQAMDGYYRLIEVNKDGRKNIFKTIYAHCSSSIQNSQNRVMIFPNPASNEINLKFNLDQDNTELNLIILNNLGQLKEQYKLNYLKKIDQYAIPLNLPSGSYMLQFESNSIQLPSQKLIIIR